VLSVVIATKDRAPFLAQTLASLSSQLGAPPFEVIAVDNGSTDSTRTLLDELHAHVPFPLTRLYVAEPNRAKARNAGIAAARGETVVFVDDDVWLPHEFLAAHAAAHQQGPSCVSGPIINVAAYEETPPPSAANYSGAFLCTCNASVPRAALEAVGAFDERFNLYGWEDTDLGLRLRRYGVRKVFAWDAFLYHIKPPAAETLDVLLRKVLERARMAARLLEKDDGIRVRLATGAYAPNLVRAQLMAPNWALPLYAGIAQNERLPLVLRHLARAQLLDGAYAGELRRALAAARQSG